MNGLCKDGNEIIIAAKDLQKLADLLDEWLNGDESTFVMLGGKDTPSIRNLVAMIDERESQAALQAIDGGLQQIVLARNQVIEMRNEIRRMFTQMEGTTATAETIPYNSPATANWDSEHRIMAFGIPQGKPGAIGPTGPRGLPPVIDVINCGGADEVWLSTIDCGDATTPPGEYKYPDPPQPPEPPEPPEPTDPSLYNVPLWDFDNITAIVPQFERYDSAGKSWYSVTPTSNGIAFVGAVGSSIANPDEDVLFIQCGGQNAVIEGLRRNNNIYPIFAQAGAKIRIGFHSSVGNNPQFWFAPDLPYSEDFYNEFAELGMKIDWMNPIEVSLTKSNLNVDTGYEEWYGTSRATGIMVVKCTGNEQTVPGQSLVQVLLNNVTALATGLRTGENAFCVPVNAGADVNLRRAISVTGQTATVYPYLLPGYVSKKYVVQCGSGRHCGDGIECGQKLLEPEPDTPAASNTPNNSNNTAETNSASNNETV